MHARDIMTAELRVALPTDSVAHVGRLMAEAGVGMIPIVEDPHRRRLVGVITDRDIVVRCVAEGRPVDGDVGDHMTRHKLATVAADAPVQAVADAMETRQLRRIPVVDASGNVIGIVSQADLARVVGPSDPGLVEKVLEKVSRK